MELPQPNEPLGIEPPSEPIIEAEKVDDIEDEEDDFKIVRDGVGIEETEITEDEKKEDVEGLKAAEEFLKKQKPKKKAGRPRKQPASGV